MWPRAVRAGLSESDVESDHAKQGREVLTKLREEIEANCSYVGDKFAEEARKIHYGETESANIYGEATTAEEREMHEERHDLWASSLAAAF